MGKMDSSADGSGAIERGEENKSCGREPRKRAKEEEKRRRKRPRMKAKKKLLHSRLCGISTLRRPPSIFAIADLP